MLNGIRQETKAKYHAWQETHTANALGIQDCLIEETQLGLTKEQVRNL